LEAETLILIYEYANKGSLMDILGSEEHFPLDKRIGIAIKTAEALQYLHSLTTGIIGHGNVAATTILLDNLSPKLTDFSGACKLIKEGQITGSDSVITRDFLEEVLYNYPIRFMSVLLNMESDVYRFGGVLFALISRDNNTSLDELVLRFTEAYQTDDSGKAIFDKVITAEEEISVLEDLGRLALKCTILNVDEMTMRPTMKEVAEQLHKIRRSWKGPTTEAATLVPEVEARDEPRLPNLMRHLYGYRRIRW
jgi:serine/threonine protein kinase